MIAKVIVDIAVNHIDRVFDYRIPEKWNGFIEKGMRVIVPFGSRKVQGFVIDIRETSEISDFKQIDDVLDLSPVLTEELIELGFWLSDQTLCFTVSALQAMLPAALKVTYKKILVLKKRDELSPELSKWFQDQDTVCWDEFEREPSHIIRLIRRQINDGVLEMDYEINDRKRRKTVKVIRPSVSGDELKKEIEALQPRKKKQKEILLWFCKHDGEIATKALLATLNTTRSAVKPLIEKKLLVETNKEVYRDPYEGQSFSPSKPLSLTPVQKNAMKPILEATDSGVHRTILLRGVTGSGKTEIYLQSIQTVLEKGKEAIVLVPEISLTPQMVARFKERFGSDVAVLHSRLSIGEKYDEWRKIQRKEVRVVIGARSAIFAPFENLGMIIIDEEHESSYKQEEHPRYHAREVAEWRGKRHRCPVVLGSATPSLESYARGMKGTYQLSEMTERVHARNMPDVITVDMREELRDGNRSMFSRVLYEKLMDRLEKREQMVLFLNRRGFSTFIICRDCGYVAECPHCDISLTFHKNDSSLKCHYCGYEEAVYTVCPNCNSRYIRHFGTGTQKVEEELTKLFPTARVIRMDVDTTSRKGAHEKLLKAFADKEGDILLGTQMIAKGLDFPNVTLVGVIAADTMLNLPDFRAAERTFQLLTQVSGRAGRHKLQGEVVIQSYRPDHYSIQFAKRQNYTDFYKAEMTLRKKYAYPPFYFITLITVSHPEVMKVITVTEKICHYLKRQLSEQAVVLGPSASVIPRIKDRYRYQCMVKYKSEPNLLNALQQILTHYSGEISRGPLQIVIDRNPQMLL